MTMTRNRIAHTPAGERAVDDRPATAAAPPSGRSRLVATRIDGGAPALQSALRAALQAERLPVADLDEPGRAFYAYTTDRATLAGFAGLQICGQHVLVRSVVVLPSHRGRRLVMQIVPHILSQAQASGANHAWLLTETSRGLFERLGFTAVERAQAPSDMAQQPQFRSLCGPRAVLMTAVLV